MKKIVLFLLVVSSFVYAKVNTVVSILPQKTFVEAIGGDKVNVSLMVKPGDSPHTYEPKPSQMRDISKAKLYFSIGVEFEEVWLPKFADLNKRMKIANMAKGIEKIEMEAHSHGEHEDHEEHAKHDEHDHDEHKHHAHEKHDEHDHHGEHEKHDDHDEHEEHAKHDHDHDGLDPHVWLSPEKVKQLADNILKYLVKVDRANESYYKANYDKFIAKVEDTDKQIKTILKDVPDHSSFLIAHPAWGYFAHSYDLEQISIEVEGKNPKPKQIVEMIEKAKKENVRVVFTSPEYTDAIAGQIAKELKVKVVKVSPLNPNWSQNLINFAKAIANK